MTEHYCGCGEHHDHSPEMADKYSQAFAKFDLHLHEEHVSHAVQHLLEQHRADYCTPETKREILGALDLTSLKVTDSQESMMLLAERVNRYANEHPDLPLPATICVYPSFAGIVSDTLEADGVGVACVSGGFPSSQTFMEIKTIETSLAVHDGATEIDCALNVGAFLSGDYETCADEIAELKAAAEDCPIKVILETGALQSLVNVKKAAILSMYAGADFIKTSTGKITPAATPEAAYVMCTTIREYAGLTGRHIGFKAAGGISTVSDAIDYYTIVRETLGADFIRQGLFRIGASRLGNLLVNDLAGSELNPF